MVRKVVLALLLVPRFALADPLPLTPVPKGEDRMSAIAQGQVAPYAGELFDTPTALRWANYLHQCKYRLEADVEFQKKLDDADRKGIETVLAAEREKYRLVTHDFETRLAKAEDPPFYKNVWFGLTLGVVGTIGLMVATAAVVNAAK
jgi:hypothetical protein